MTAAFNLSQLANFVNTSGQLDLSTGSTGGISTSQLPIVPIAKGGLNTSSTPSNGQIPIGNGSGYTLATLTGGANISISNSAGSITITNTGLSSLVATAYGVGSYAIGRMSGATRSAGDAVAGSTINMATFVTNQSGTYNPNWIDQGTQSGTWQVMTSTNSSNSSSISLVQRIS